MSESSGPSDWNQKIIEEFRANAGKVGGYFEGAPMILIHHVGARTGTERVNPLVYLPDGDDMVIAATKGGAPTNPDWYHNLKAHPRDHRRGRDRHLPGRGDRGDGPERDDLWRRLVELRPGFAEYVTKTDARLPDVPPHPGGLRGAAARREGTGWSARSRPLTVSLCGTRLPAAAGHRSSWCTDGRATGGTGGTRRRISRRRRASRPWTSPVMATRGPGGFDGRWSPSGTTSWRFWTSSTCRAPCWSATPWAATSSSRRRGSDPNGYSAWSGWTRTGS